MKRARQRPATRERASTTSTAPSITSTRRPIPCTSSAATPSPTIARSSDSARRRWRSAAWPACCSRSRRCCAVMGPHPAAFVRRFEPARRGPHRAARAPLDPRPRPGGAAADPAADAARSRFDRGVLPRRRRPVNARRRRGARLVLDVARSRPICARPTARAVRSAGVCYFFPRPSAGSACKRLNLFLRWMVRRDAIDLGVWTRVAPSRLIVPLDTHVIRLGPLPAADALHVSPGWKMAAEITASLRRSIRPIPSATTSRCATSG